MDIQFKKYDFETRFSKDYFQIVDFLEEVNEKSTRTNNFLWGRWAWMISRPVDNESMRGQIGIWLKNNNIIGLATFELDIGKVYIVVDKDSEYIMIDIIQYVKNKMSINKSVEIIINDNNRYFQEIARSNGFVPTQESEKVSVMFCEEELEYNLPENFKIISMKEEWDWKQYNRVMWRGFNHQGEPSHDKEDLDFRKCMLSSPHLDKELCLAVLDADGNYVSHCCLWHQPGSKVAYVEPVATDPDYRKRGLAKGALYEAINRAMSRGACEMYVGSSQQFYYNIGFAPHSTETWWKGKCINE